MRKPVMRAGVALLLIMVFVVVPAFAAQSDPAQVKANAPSADPADWPMYNHDAAGWRFNSAEHTLSPANVGKLVEKWRFPVADSKETIGVVHATPAVVAGEVYFGTATFPAFYKLNRDGTLCWVYRNPARTAVLPPTAGAPITDRLRGAASDGGIFSFGARRGRSRVLCRHRRLDVLSGCANRQRAVESR